LSSVLVNQLEETFTYCSLETGSI